MSDKFDFLREESETIKEIFAGEKLDEAQANKVCGIFKKYIETHLEYGYCYFILFVDRYASVRPHDHKVAIQLANCVFESFPDNVDEIKQYINQYDHCFKKIFFYENQTNSPTKMDILIPILQKDDVDGLATFIEDNYDFPLNEVQDYEIPHQNVFIDIYPFSSPLDLCCIFGSLECFKFLYARNCEIKNSTLIFAIEGGNREIINILRNKYLGDYIMTSIICHRYDLTQWLLEKFTIGSISLPDCITYYNFDAFLYFLDHGHSINEYDRQGNFCIHEAAKIGHIKLFKSIIQQGAGIEQKSGAGLTPLLSACGFQQNEILNYLISCDASISTKGSLLKTPLHVACQTHSVQMVRTLVENGALPHIQLSDIYGWTPLHSACQYGDLPIVKYLIEKGADIEAQNDFKETPLHIASKFGNTDIVEYLVSLGADKNAKQDSKMTPYQLASNEEIKQILKPKCIIG